MAYNENIIDKNFVNLPNQINRVNNLYYSLNDNREISINLNDSFTLYRTYVKDGVYLEGKELFRYILRNNYLQNNNNVTHINFFLYDYLSYTNGNPFLVYSELSEESNTISYDINWNNIYSELQKDKDGNDIPFFRICSEYKFTAIKENFKIIDEVLTDLGISYKVIYVPNPYFPEYSNEISTVTANSPFIYGMDFNEFEEKYHHKFKLNSDIDRNIDTISCKDEIDWLASKYYEDVYMTKSIIKGINHLVEFGLGIDFYTHFGNYCHDELLLLDHNEYSNFQEQILFSEDLMYPFADFLYIDNINYDYCIVPNTTSSVYSKPELSLTDIRTLNERIDLVCSKYKYPLDKIEIGLLNVFRYEDDLSFLKTIDSDYFSNSYSIINLINGENISRRFPSKSSEDTPSKANYIKKQKVNSFIHEEKSSVLDYLRKIYLINANGMDTNIEFNLNDYNGMLLYILRKVTAIR